MSAENPTLREWRIASLLTTPALLFVVVQIGNGSCKTRADFRQNFGDPVMDYLSETLRLGFVNEVDRQLVLTEAGQQAYAQFTQETFIDPKEGVIE